MRVIIACLAFCCASLSTAFAAELSAFPIPTEKPSPHKLFLSSHPYQTSETFDLWKVEGGYSYTLFDSVDLYVGAHLDNSYQNNEKGFLSGVSYRFNDKISVDSTLRSSREELNNGEKENVLSAEVTSRVQLSNHLHLHATLDYEEWQQGIELGLGFRF
ncbi:ribonuclease regulator [Vibrio albus]|jgi:hypothetical protein|uniref:Ribonuclease regulator n=1 Tax=Vibrio albus TaxID=2200953 RepID=A0A2U3BF05_9VIBR|nr:ribonuclease regulator [Vibrio albus]PWI35332.1 ribonuclease regulator [Vibrio albus]